VAALDGADRRHRTVAIRRPRPWISRIPRLHVLRASNHLRIGTMVRH
jgi:hypothetical protein